MKLATASTLFAFYALLASPSGADSIDAPPATDACEYSRLFIDTSATAMGLEAMRTADGVRRELLEIARQVYPYAGWEIVRNRASAYWVLRGYASPAPGGFALQLGMTAELRLQHHVFVARLDNKEFPDHGDLASTHIYELPEYAHPEMLRPGVIHGSHWMRDRQSAVIEALCETSEELREEGWTGIKELRMELVEEMQRVRRGREQEYQKKKLELEIE